MATTVVPVGVEQRRDATGVVNASSTENVLHRRKEEEQKEQQRAGNGDGRQPSPLVGEQEKAQQADDRRRTRTDKQPGSDPNDVDPATTANLGRD